MGKMHIVVQNHVPIPKDSEYFMQLECANKYLRIDAHNNSAYNLAMLSGISCRKIELWKNGDIILLIDELKKIGKLLDVNIWETN